MQGSPGFEHLRSLRDSGRIVVIDGAMGTELQARGVPMDEHAWCGVANLRAPDLVREIHEDHIRAGADVVIANTYMSGLGPMQRAGLGDRFEEGNLRAVRAARAAIDGTAVGPVALAGSVSVTPWAAPESGHGSGERAQIRDGYARQVDVLARAGVDLIALEMVVDTRLGQPAVEAALAGGLPVWLGLSMQVAGADPKASESLPPIEPDAREIARACLRDELDAVNIMHTDIHDVADGIEMARELWTGPLGVYPHHGIWKQPDWTFEDVPVQQLVELAQDWVRLGATMLGGCCGLRTHHVAALRELADSRGSA
ncbi:MAG TPA: homocysteine S-methyltransferase family protein [Solirubrobacteraceae bacterium]|jgi:homocysteine S-methyltransferase